MDLLFEHPRAVVIRGDCREVADLLGLQSVDHVLTDPPFSKHVQMNIRSLTNEKGTPGKGARVKKWAPIFDPLEGFDHVLDLVGLARRWSLFFCALEHFGAYQQAGGGPRNLGGTWIRSWVWRKHQAAPSLCGKQPANSCEGIAVFHSPRPADMRWNGRGAHAWTDLDEMGEEFPEEGYVDNCVEAGRERRVKAHPTRKPPPLIAHLVTKFTDPGDMLFDGYAGSGSLAEAALPLGRRVFLVESDVEPCWKPEDNCSKCGGEGTLGVDRTAGEYGKPVKCDECEGTGHVGEPSGSWAEECAALCRSLVD